MASKIKVDQIEGSTGSTITVPTGQTLTIVDGVPVASGGTSFTSFTAGDVLYATGSTTLAKLPKGTAEQILSMNSGATLPEWTSADISVLPTITVAKGGTNLESFTAGDILYATGATTLAKLAKGSAADTLKMNAGATAPEWGSGITESASNPTVSTNPSALGTRFINTTSGELFVCTDITAGENVWKGQLDSTVKPPERFGGRGVFMGGYDGAWPSGNNSDVIDYITIASLGDAIDFGDLAVVGQRSGQALSNGTRGVCCAGGTDDTIEYITFATPSDATDFGNLTVGRRPSGVSSGYRGCFGGGASSDDTIDYITIATASDATDFGNLTTGRRYPTSLSNKTRGLFAGGDD